MTANIPFDVWRLVGAHDAFIWNALVRAIPGLHAATNVESMKARHMNVVTHTWEKCSVNIPALNGRMHTNGEYVQALDSRGTIHVHAANGKISREGGMPAIEWRSYGDVATVIRQFYVVNGKLSHPSGRVSVLYFIARSHSDITTWHVDAGGDVLYTECISFRNDIVTWTRRKAGKHPMTITCPAPHDVDIFSLDTINLAQYVVGYVALVNRSSVVPTFIREYADGARSLIESMVKNVAKAAHFTDR